MIARSRPVRRRKPVPGWHQGFLRMLPAICLRARVSFRHLDPEAREEAVQNCIANAMIAYARLYELGKVDLAYPTALARYAVSQTKDGRVTGGQLNGKDISSVYCQRQTGIVVGRLDHHDRVDDAWKEILVEDRHCGPFDIVCAKLDFETWLQSLPRKKRQIAQFLARDERTTDAAKKFGVCEGRISQVRRELKKAWETFQGELEPAAA